MRRGEIAIFQQARELALELGAVLHEEPAPAALQQLRALAEVAHVRAHEHRLAAHRRLQHVVPADRHEAAADEDDLGERVEGGQLAHGVEDHDRAGRGVRGEAAAPGRDQAALADQLLDLAGALRVAGRQQQGQIRAARPRAQERVEDDRFLAAVRAARDPEPRVRVEA